MAVTDAPMSCLLRVEYGCPISVVGQKEGVIIMKSPIIHFSFFILLICVSLSNAQIVSWQAFPVAQSTDEQQFPKIHGRHVVWQQYVAEHGDYDVYIADINEPETPWVLVIGDANDQMNPDIWRNTVVWQDYATRTDVGDWDIWAAHISDFNEPELFAVSAVPENDEQMPAISGNIVVWQDGFPGDYNIYGADITRWRRPAEFPIATYDANQTAPTIYRNTVVWQDDYWGDWDIFGSDIWLRNQPWEFDVAPFADQQTAPCASRGVVVWQDDFEGSWDIYGASTDEQGVLDMFAISTDPASQVNPCVDGHIVVWQDARQGNWDIYGYNLLTQQEFQITTDLHDQIHPRISANTVVWQDNRDGSWNVYAMILDGPEIEIPE